MTEKQTIDPKIVKALLQSERKAMASRLLRGVVHNLSGAMQQVRLPLDLLELRLSQDMLSEALSDLESLQEGAQRLTDELQLLALRSGQDTDDEPKEIELSQLAREQLNFWPCDMFFKHEAAIETDLPYVDSRTKASYTDVALAFNALIANALESLKQSHKQSLKISIWDQDETVYLVIEDDGPGPDKALKERLFEPFTSTKDESHSGLGLFLAQEAIKPWQGKILDHSVNNGVFLLGFPRNREV